MIMDAQATKNIKGKSLFFLKSLYLLTWHWELQYFAPNLKYNLAKVNVKGEYLIFL
jgi:hypothetical protein